MGDFRPWHLLVATNMLLLAGLVWSNVQSATPDAEIIRAKSVEPGASLTTRDSEPGLTLSKAGAAPVMIAP
jgi:hypothetical protein